MYDSNFQVLDELSRVLNKEMAAMVKEQTNIFEGENNNVCHFNSCSQIGLRKISYRNTIHQP